jgi:signal transduction histidine kinase
VTRGTALAVVVGAPALFACWQLAVPALMGWPADAAPAPEVTAACALAGVLLPTAWAWLRARRGAPPGLPAEVAAVTALAAAAAAAWMQLRPDRGAVALPLAPGQGEAMLAAGGFGLLIAPLAGALAPRPPPGRGGKGMRLRTIVGGLALLPVAGGWCILAPATLAAVPAPARVAFVTTLVLLAAGAVVAAATLAWMLGHETGRELGHAAAAMRGLDAASPPAPRLAGAGDPELAELAAELARLGTRLAAEVSAFDATVARAREADEAREEFLRVVSHELRTPLNSICGYAQLLLEGIDGPLGDDAKDSVRAILDSGRTLSALVDDVVDLAMLSSGRPGLKLAPVDAAALAQEVTRSLGSLAHGRPLELVVEPEPGLPRVLADRKRLRQVLVNLLSNALKFTDEGRVTCALRRQGDMVEIEVSDTGVGIAEQELPGIFDEFRQGSNNRAGRRQKGAGLGLAICRRLVELHGGAIRAESTPGAGARFVFVLPVEGPTRRPALTTPPPDMGVSS